MKIQQCLFKLLRKQNVTDGQTDGRTHGHTHTCTHTHTDNVKTVYPPQTKFAGGIINNLIFKDCNSESQGHEFKLCKAIYFPRDLANSSRAHVQVSELHML